MPVRCSDSKKYCQWGSHGKKYVYDPNSNRSKSIAKRKATRQGIAAHASGWHGSKKGGSRSSLRYTSRVDRRHAAAAGRRA